MRGELASRGGLAKLTLAAVLLVCVVPARGQENPQALVATVVHNELHSQGAPRYWIYLDSNTSHGKTELTRVLEQPECWLKWPIAINGHPPSPEQREQAKKKIEELVSDKQQREKARKEINEDSSKANGLLKILPDAFIFTPAGEKNGLLALKFKPNPNYSPASDEAKVFHAMAGVLYVNEKEKRLAKLTGTLTHNVDFGWGILGKIEKGGTFTVVQTEVAPQDWELTLLDVHISGHALFFHTIGDQQHEMITHFKPVAADVSMQEAAKLVESPGQQ